MSEPCISACQEKMRMGLIAHPCRACVIDKLCAAAEFTFAFLDSCEWNDETSATQAEDAKALLRGAIAAADAL